MKTCINCGASIQDNNNFCPQCGTRCDNGKDIERSVYQGTGNYSAIRAESYPMKWHKFLMVIMILGGIVTIGSGIGYMAGYQYNNYEYAKAGLNPVIVYRAFPGLKTCDMFYGIALIALGVFEFIVRNRLNQYRANGPMSLKIMYILSIVATLIYMIWASTVTNLSYFTMSNIGSLGSSALFLIINSIYYSKRSELFVN